MLNELRSVRASIFLLICVGMFLACLPADPAESGSYSRVISDVTERHGLIREVRDSPRGQQKVALVALSNTR